MSKLNTDKMKRRILYNLTVFGTPLERKASRDALAKRAKRRHQKQVEAGVRGMLVKEAAL